MAVYIYPSVPAQKGVVLNAVRRSEYAQRAHVVVKFASGETYHEGTLFPAEGKTATLTVAPKDTGYTLEFTFEYRRSEAWFPSHGVKKIATNPPDANKFILGVDDINKDLDYNDMLVEVAFK